MKKILVITLLALGATTYANNHTGSNLLAVATPTYNQINKIKGGLFGYRSVATTTDNNGNKITNCSNPGRKKCNVELLVGETPMTAEQHDALDRYITSLLTPEHTSGTVLYNEKTVVTYSYNIDNNGLTYNVYSLQSAAENGIIW